MKVLFAVSNDNITTSIVNKYQQKYKEIITSKNVYYFNAIIKELQKDKSYDAIVVGEDLEPISTNNYDAIDKFIFEKLDGISDEASKPTGEDIPIIFICSDRRTQSDQLLIKLFGIGIYNAIIGNDRSIDTVCNLINKPRNKKEAKNYYKVESEQVGLYESKNDQDVSESEIQNILSYYKKIGTNVKKCVESFDKISKQYSDTQLRIIINFLPNEVKSILESNSKKYQKLVNGGTVLSSGSYQPYQRQNPRMPRKVDFLTKDLEKSAMTKPVIIPSSININKGGLSQEQYNVSNYNSIGQGVNREKMPQINNNNMNNASIPDTTYKKGRGRPRKVSATPNVVQQQAINPSMNQPQVAVPGANQAQTPMTGINQPQAVIPGVNQTQTPITGTNQPQVVVPETNQAQTSVIGMSQPQTMTTDINQSQTSTASVNQPQMQTSNANEVQVGVSNTQGTKRKRGRPPKQANLVTQPDNLPTLNAQPVAPVVSEQNSGIVNSAPVQDAKPTNAFDDMLPGFEESADTVNLFNMDSTNNSQDSTESTMLPGFDNDIENMDSNGENSNDTNLFDLDLEENTQTSNVQAPYNSQTTQNSTINNANINQYGTNNTMSNPYEMASNSYNAMDNPYGSTSSPYSNAMDNPYGSTSSSYNNAMDNPYGSTSSPYNNAMNNPYGSTNSYNTNNNSMNNSYNMNTNYNNSNDIYNTNSNYNNMNKGTNKQYGQYQNANNMYNSYNTNNNSNSYMPNSYENSMTSTMQQNSYNNNSVLAGNGKIVAFVGTTKNGTSFIVNNLAQLLSQNGVKTAVLDLTKNKNSYYMFTDNDAHLMKKATESLKKLSSGIVDGVEVNKNLTVFTSLPEENEELNKDVALKTLSNNFEIALLDCDFETKADYFVSANEIYLIQSMDTFTIQPLTQFLSDLKLKNMLDESKLRIVINKYVKLKKLDERLIIGGMSKYNEPSMTLQRDLFNAQTIKYAIIPFEIDTYSKYLESIAMCTLNLNGYPQSFLQALEELKNMVYPLISDGNRNMNQQNNTDEKHGLFGGKKNKQQAQSTQFSNNVNDTLNKMRTNNF